MILILRSFMIFTQEYEIGRIDSIQAHPEEKEKEELLIKELEQVKIDSDKALDADPVKKAEAIAALEKAKLSAIDVEKLIRKE